MSIDEYKVKTAYLLLDRIKEKHPNVKEALRCLDAAFETPDQPDEYAEKALHSYIHHGENGAWVSTGSHFADMKHGFLAGFEAARKTKRESGKDK